MIEALIIGIFGLINRLRGSDVPLTNKVITSLVCGVIMGIYAENWVIFSIVSIGIYIWAVFGWGKYFAAFHGRYNVNEKEFYPADLVADKLYLKGKLNANDAGMVGMAIRALLALPMFIGLGIYLNSYLPLYGLLMALQGVIYRDMKYLPEEKAIPVAEVLTGCLLGGLILLSI
jgi:hypothetical protein